MRIDMEHERTDTEHERIDMEQERSDKLRLFWCSRPHVFNHALFHSYLEKWYSIALLFIKCMRCKNLTVVLYRMQ